MILLPFIFKGALDFVAYVAKDSRYGRACFVLECGGGLAQDVITTIGQAFELRFKEFMKKSPKSQPERRAVSATNRKSSQCHQESTDYYNDLPGKVPPDIKPPNSFLVSLKESFAYI